MTIDVFVQGRRAKKRGISLTFLVVWVSLPSAQPPLPLPPLHRVPSASRAPLPPITPCLVASPIVLPCFSVLWVTGGAGINFAEAERARRAAQEVGHGAHGQAVGKQRHGAQ